MHRLRVAISILMLGLVATPSHWCCAIDWGDAAPSCCVRRDHERVSKCSSCTAKSCCAANRNVPSRTPSKFEVPPSSCPCFDRPRAAIAKAWEVQVADAFAPLTWISLSIESDLSSGERLLFASALSQRRLQVVLCRWNC